METIDGTYSKHRVPAVGRSSKKLFTDKQSTHAVIYNDDLLIKILLLLPVISLFQLKTVCKRWLSLISDPTFTLRRSQIPTLEPACGLLVQSYHIVSSGEYDLLSFDTRIPGKSSMLKNPFTIGSKLHNFKILQSCNGLLLLHCSNTWPNKYYVYNPCINLLKVIPQCSIKTVYGAKLAFDPTKSPHYKVIVYVDDADDDDNIYSIRIQTYSSQTGTWTDTRSVCIGRYPRSSFLYFDGGIYWNDALYWLLNNWDDPSLFKLDINAEHQTLTTIKTPRTLDGELYRGFQLFETCGCLLLLCRKYGHPLLMDVYERRKGYSEWLVKYRVNLNDDVSCPRRLWTNPIVYTIVSGEREEDSYILIKDSGKIFQYKPVLKTSHDLVDLKSVHGFYCFQFVASFAGVGL